MRIPYGELGQEICQPLSGVDSLHFVFERPGLPQVLCTTVTVDTSTSPEPVTPELWREHLARRALQIPLLYRVLRPTPFGRGMWVHTGEVDLDHHFRHEWHRGALTDEVRTAYVARRFKEPVDWSRPPWEISILQRSDGPETVICIRLHHSLLDGLFAYAVFSSLFDPTAETPDLGLPIPVPEVVQRAAELTEAEIRRIGWQHSMRAKADALVDLAPFLHDVRRAAVEKERITTEAEAAYVARGLSARSPWARKPSSGQVEVSWSRIECARLRTIMSEYSVGFNDVILGLYTAAFRDRMLEEGVTPTKPLICGYPVSTRSTSRYFDAGNRTGNFNVPLPVHLRDPGERLRFLARATDVGKRRFDVGARPIQDRLARLVPETTTDALISAYGKLGLARLHRPVFDGFATVLPHYPQARYLLGARLVDIFSTSALNDVLHTELVGVRNRSTLRLAFTNDPVAFGRGAAFSERMSEEVTALEQSRVRVSA